MNKEKLQINRIKITICGAVQGVGFRPFIYRLATEMDLRGWVINSSSGVFIEAEGKKSILDNFVLRIEKEKPPHSIINSLEFSFLDPIGFDTFEIRKSEESDEISAFILPDINVCNECLKEMYDPENRRYLYPFINCTNCGPRFSIIESLPYDRPNTSMKIFEMCEQCRAEYEDPQNRRFHAQPIACHDCGPWIELWDEAGNKIVSHDNGLKETINHINSGKIIALKGLGGFQLIVDATNGNAVQRLRDRKHREEKPFALMFPTLDSVKAICQVSGFEERLLLSAESPIVLLKHHLKDSNLAENVAPENPNLGIMLPYTPLHHMIMKELDKPIIATSANLTEEPMVIDEKIALQKLKGIADYFLIHNRPIRRHVDDSIVRVIMGQELVLRRARGYAPLPISLNAKTNIGKSFLAGGAHLKNTVALSSKNNIFISQHIGDLETDEALTTFSEVIDDFAHLYDTHELQPVCDLHPEYLSTKYMKQNYPDVIQVQHHQAHIAACRAENQVSGKAIGISWDGTGYGTDGSIWGGEFFISNDNGFEHIGQLRKFKLPGGDQAVKEPRRSALGLLFEIYGAKLFDKKLKILNLFSKSEINVLKQMLIKNINCPITSSAGRLFDGIAALLNIRSTINFEGQAAMMLEFSVDMSQESFYPFEIINEDVYIVDWEPILKSILTDIGSGEKREIIAAKFHNTLVEIICTVVEKVGIDKVVLSGGCFQNIILLSKTIKRLEEKDFNVYRHQRIPPNDGGISLGQVVVAAQKLGH